MRLNRREFQKRCIRGAVAASGSSLLLPNHADAIDIGTLETFVPTRAITRGPKNHWFGYYDKREFDPSGKLVLANELSFEGRSPTGGDSIGVGYVDTSDSDRWYPIGKSQAWGWQQGCMLQWVGNDGQQILWNDREGDAFVCRIYRMKDQSVRTLPRPIYTISSRRTIRTVRRFPPYRQHASWLRLRRIGRSVRQPACAASVRRMANRLGNGPREDSFCHSPMSRRFHGPTANKHSEAWHYFNHLLINPSGTRFIVLHRYRPEFDPTTLQYKGGL